MTADDPYPDMEPFPFADLFAHGWVAGAHTSAGGEYVVACLGCRARLRVHDRPRALPRIDHDEDCPVAAYISEPHGGAEGRAFVQNIVHTPRPSAQPWPS